MIQKPTATYPTNPALAVGVLARVSTPAQLDTVPASDPTPSMRVKRSGLGSSVVHARCWISELEAEMRSVVGFDSASNPVATGAAV